MTLNVRNFVFQHHDTREAIITRRKGRHKAGKTHPERGGVRTVKIERFPEDWLRLAAPIHKLQLRKAKLSDRPQYAAIPLRPMPTEIERPKGQGTYSRAQFDIDYAIIDRARAMVRTAFVKGQMGEGPIMDGCEYLKRDNLLIAEQMKCERRFGAMVGMILSNKKAQKLAQRTPTLKQASDPSKWIDLGSIEMATKFAQRGYKVRTIEAGRTKRFEALVIGAPK